MEKRSKQMKRLFKPDVMSRSNEQDMGTDTHMHGSMLAFARVMLMVLVVCILAYFIASLPEIFVTLHQPCTVQWCTNAPGGRLTAIQIQSLSQADLSLDAYVWFWIGSHADYDRLIG